MIGLEPRMAWSDHGANFLMPNAAHNCVTGQISKRIDVGGHLSIFLLGICKT